MTERFYLSRLFGALVLISAAQLFSSQLALAQFTQQGPKLVGTGAVGSANEGWSVALSGDGNIAIVGGAGDNGFAGAVWVFTRRDGVWTQQGSKLVGTGAVGVQPAVQGASVALSGDGRTVIESGDGDNVYLGAAWVFVKPPSLAHKTNTHDFNGDGYSDIAWRNTNGDAAIWLMNTTPSGGAQILSTTDLGNVSNRRQIVGQRDFNGDGNADLLWSNTNGDSGIWLMNGAQVLRSINLGVVPSGWSIVGTGDFNGDGYGYGDILWRNANGDTAIWLMTGTTTQVQAVAMVDLGVVPTSWNIAGTGDFNGDGYTDILWYNANGDTGVWLMTGTATQVQMSSWTDFGMVPTGWTIVGTGDFNGDGYTDILWRNANGDTAIWLMTGNGSEVLLSSANDLGVFPTSWNVAVTGDFNRDGRSDILWSNADGDTAIWFMNGATMLSVSDLGIVSNGWIVQGAGAD
jgi:uncharacterized protein YbdZ (MbtH family)